jgi:hypothetical protein
MPSGSTNDDPPGAEEDIGSSDWVCNERQEVAANAIPTSASDKMHFVLESK